MTGQGVLKDVYMVLAMSPMNVPVKMGGKESLVVNVLHCPVACMELARIEKVKMCLILAFAIKAGWDTFATSLFVPKAAT